jgi:hypothetical protein
VNRLRAVAIAVAASAAATVLTGAAAQGLSGSKHRRISSTFTLHGHVGGLYPGARTRLLIAVNNRGRRPLRVRSITTRVRDAKPGCSAKNLQVDPYRGRLRVGAGRRRNVSVSVRMLPTTPVACQGALFPLAFRGRATR